MKIIKLFITISFLFLTTLSTFSQNASLKGKLLNNKKYTEIKLQDISYNTLETQKIDANGNFKFTTNFDSFDFYLLALSKKEITAFLPVPGEQTEITIDLNNINKPTIVNSAQTKLYYDCINELRQIKSRADKIEFVKKMVKENPTSPACVLFISALNPEEYFEYHESLSKGLKPYADNKLIADFIKQTKNIKNLSAGGQAPEIALPNPDGEIKKLSSLKGKYVLIDFWASWCKPCRMENPHNVKLYKEYKDKGFEIFAVSLDKDKNAWTNAINKDKLVWTNVSDLKFWESEAAKLYGVKGIPYTVLLDKDGKIIAKGLRGDKLSLKLKEIFKQ